MKNVLVGLEGYVLYCVTFAVPLSQIEIVGGSCKGEGTRDYRCQREQLKRRTGPSKYESINTREL